MTTAGRLRRAGALTAAALLAMAGSCPAAQAIPPPAIDPSAVPSDGTPGPDEPMRQSNICAQAITVADPNVAVTAPEPTFSISAATDDAWQSRVQ